MLKTWRVACTTAVLLLLVAGASSTRVHAWSAQGHRLVALVAAGRLTPVARRNVVWMLGRQSLADVSSWADRYLDGHYQTFYWHFLNIPPDATRYDRDRDCPAQPGVSRGARADKWRDCAVDRILYNKERLADASLDRADRAIALKFLVHFVGDLHQPFHALGVGRGGNDIPVTVFGDAQCGSYRCNLHGVWDGSLVAHRNRDDGQYLRSLQELIRRNGWDARAALGPEQWAIESHGLAVTALLPSGGNVDETYFQAHIPSVEQRMAIGGLRLAALLNEVLTAPPPS